MTPSGVQPDRRLLVPTALKDRNRHEDELQEAGSTVIMVRVDSQAVGALGLADRPGRAAGEAVEKLTCLTGSLRCS